VGALVSAAVHSTPGSHFVCNGTEFSTDIATLPLIVACVWHLQLQLGKLAPLIIIHKAHYCATLRLAHYENCTSKMFCAMLQSALSNQSVGFVVLTKALFTLMHTLC
jgi:hypothetical protein